MRVFYLLRNIALLSVLMAVSGSAMVIAAPIDEIIKSYLTEIKKIDANFRDFEASKGKELYHAKRTRKDGKKTSCETCHTPDPKMPGKSQAGKVIEPMAPIVNPKRFTDRAKVEKWFKRNCMDVYERVCTAAEKGHFIKYLQSIK